MFTLRYLAKTETVNDYKNIYVCTFLKREGTVDSIQPLVQVPHFRLGSGRRILAGMRVEIVGCK
jgi:hypothetical protein